MELKDKSFSNPKALRIAVVKGSEDKKKALFIIKKNIYYLQSHMIKKGKQKLKQFILIE